MCMYGRRVIDKYEKERDKERDIKQEEGGIKGEERQKDRHRGKKWDRNKKSCLQEERSNESNDQKKGKQNGRNLR